MQRFKLSRRRFLKGANGAFLALPLLPSLFVKSEWALADTLPAAQTFILSPWTHGFFAQEMPNVLPIGAKNASPALNSVAYRELGNGARDFQMSQLPANFSPYLSLPELMEVQQHLLVIQGLDALFGGHNNYLVGGGYADPAAGTPFPGATIDYIIANKLNPQNPDVLCMSLTNNHDFVTYSVGRTGTTFTPTPPTVDPLALWGKLFFGMSGSGVNTAAVTAANKTQVDYLTSEIAALSKAASAADKQILQEWVDHAHNLQQRIQPHIASACVPPAKGAAVSGQLPAGAFDGAAADAYMKTMIDLLVAGIKCDLVHSVNLRVNQDSFQNCFAALPEDFHACRHDMRTEEVFPIIALCFRNIGYLIKQLDTVANSATGDTYIKNSLLFLSTDVTAYAHDHQDLPVIMAGQAAGFFKTGRLLSYHQLDQPHYPAYLGGNVRYYGRPFSQLLVSIMTAFGLKPADWEGLSAIGSTGITGPTTLYAADAMNVLPGLNPA